MGSEDGGINMEVKPINFEKSTPVVVPTMDLYETHLERRMFLTQEPQGADRKDLFKWLEKTSMMSGEKKAPVIGMLNFNSGRTTIELSSEKPLPEVINENTPVSQVLEVQARTKAKLDFVADSDTIPVEVRDQARKVAKMITKESRGIQEDLSKQVEVKVGKAPSKRMSRRQFLQTAVTGAGGLFLAACNARVDALPTTPVSPSETPTARATETYTAPTSKPETSTPTEAPLFTEAEVEAGDPFDLSSFPERFQLISKNFVNATDQEWLDLHEFILSVREDKGIPRTVEYGDKIPKGLESYVETGKWKMENGETRRTVISPTELMTMLLTEPVYYYQASVVVGGKETPLSMGLGGSAKFYLDPIVQNNEDLQIFKSENIGPILGRNNIEIPRWPYDEGSGILFDVVQIEGKNGLVDLAVIDMEKDGSHVFFPVLLLQNERVLPKGTKTLVENTIEGPVYVLLEDLSLAPTENFNSTYIADNIGGIFSVVNYFFNTPSQKSNFYVLHPDFNIEMAKRVNFVGTSIFKIPSDNKYWPWN